MSAPPDPPVVLTLEQFLAQLRGLVSEWRALALKEIQDPNLQRTDRSLVHGVCANQLETLLGAAPVVGIAHQSEKDQNDSRVDVPAHAPATGSTAHTASSHVPTEHELKCWPEFYREIESGRKTFELRKDDRGYRCGDVLLLREWRRNRIVNTIGDGDYTGRALRRTVTYVLSGDVIQPGFVCMSLAPFVGTHPEADCAVVPGAPNVGKASLRANDSDLNSGVVGIAPPSPPVNEEKDDEDHARMDSPK